MRILLCWCVLMFCSCSKADDTPNATPRVEAINDVYFIKWQYSSATGKNLLAASQFEYDNNSLVKRSGSYLPVFGGYDYSSYTNQVFDTIIKVNEQKILLESKNKLPFGSPNTPKWEIELNADKPVRRISYIHRLGNYMPVDTAVYFYDANNRVQKIEFHSSAQGLSYLLTKTFIFNDFNLQKIKSVYLQKPNTVWYFAEEEFGAYDNKTNPLKPFWIWDDLYYRSISANNFSKYTYKKFDAQNILTDSVSKSWNLQYDENGNIHFK